MFKISINNINVMIFYSIRAALSDGIGGQANKPYLMRSTHLPWMRNYANNIHIDAQLNNYFKELSHFSGKLIFINGINFWYSLLFTDMQKFTYNNKFNWLAYLIIIIIIEYIITIIILYSIV